MTPLSREFSSDREVIDTQGSSTMSATVRVFQSILSFPWGNGNAGNDDDDNTNDRLLKRRKTQTAGIGNSRCSSVMRMSSDLTCTSASSSDDTEEFMSDDAMDGNQTLTRRESSSSPFQTFSQDIQNRGVPSRLDPFSIDHFVHFEGANGTGRHQAFPLELVVAIQHRDQQHILQKCSQYGASTYLKSLRTSEGETLLHLAAQTGCHALIQRLLQPGMGLPLMVLDRKGRSPLHALCIAMNSGHSPAMQQQQLETMRVLLQHSPMLVLYMDQERLTPLEYLQSNHHAHHHQVNTLLMQELVVDRVAHEMSQQMQKAQSGQRMTAMETVDRMVNLSGVDAAIMEAGFSI